MDSTYPKIFKHIPEEVFQRVMDELQDLRDQNTIPGHQGPSLPDYQLLLFMLCKREPEYLSVAVHLALDNARSGGYEDWLLGTKIEDIASDLGDHDSDLEGREPYELTPHIEAWFNENGLTIAQFSNEELAASVEDCRDICPNEGDPTP